MTSSSKRPPSGRSRTHRSPAGRPSSGRPITADPAREAAFDTLRTVADDDAYANLVLPGMLRERRLDSRDAALATELTYGTLRFLGTYDAILAGCVDRPLESLDPPVLDVLRLGVHQLLAMRTPVHAAVSTSVDLARSRIGKGPSGLVNAVLRKVAAQSLDEWVESLAPVATADPVERLALLHAHPPWVARAFQSALGASSAELEAALAADNEPPGVMLAARPGRVSVEELVSGGAVAARWSPYGAVLDAGDPSSFPAVRDRRAGVQDEGSQLVTVALTAVPIEGTDDRWLDMCAGPGGKAALLAGIGAERGAGLVAAEKHEHRARLVDRALYGTPGHHEVLVVDSTEPPWPEGDFDRVLLDAPCTGLGALRRRPEARWRRKPSDVAELRTLQVALLRSAIRSVRPGGVVGYVTCTPHPAETSVVVQDAIGDRDDVERIDARPFLPGVPDLGDGPDIQLWPHRHGTDAMYLSLLRRR